MLSTNHSVHRASAGHRGFQSAAPHAIRLSSMHSDLRRAFKRQTHRRPLIAQAENDADALFVATNNFKVKPEHCEDFENVWKKRDTHLKEFDGFIRFALLRCDDVGEYRSESFWKNRAAFDSWRKSEQFTKSHKEVGATKQGEEVPKMSTMQMLDGRPSPKFYEAVTVTE